MICPVCRSSVLSKTEFRWTSCRCERLICKHDERTGQFWWISFRFASGECLTRRSQDWLDVVTGGKMRTIRQPDEIAEVVDSAFSTFLAIQVLES